MSQDWRDVKVADIGMERRYYNKIAGRLARLVFNLAKEQNLVEVMNRIAGKNIGEWDAGSVTLGDIERIGFREFVSMPNVGPATFREFLEKAVAHGMKLEFDGDSYFFSKKLGCTTEELWMFSDYKCFDIYKKTLDNVKQKRDEKAYLNIKIDEKPNYENLSKLKENLFVGGIDVLLNYPAKLFAENTVTMKKIKDFVKDYLSKFEKEVKEAESLAVLDKKEKQFNEELSRFDEIVKFQRSQIDRLEERKGVVGDRISEKLADIDKKYHHKDFVTTRE